MPVGLSVENLSLVLGLLVPGLVALFVRAQFLTGRLPSHGEALLSYLALSVIYYALVFPVVEWLLDVKSPTADSPFAWFAMIFVGPSLFGLFLGLFTRKGWGRRIARVFRLNTVHVMPTAWDWKFGDMPEQWVLVTLKDGTKFAGHCGLGSFMSSDPKERDLYIERIYDIGNDNVWTPRGLNGVLIAAGEIRTIEFWPVTEGNGE